MAERAASSSRPWPCRASFPFISSRWGPAIPRTISASGFARPPRGGGSPISRRQAASPRTCGRRSPGPTASSSTEPSGRATSCPPSASGPSGPRTWRICPWGVRPAASPPCATCPRRVASTFISTTPIPSCATIPRSERRPRRRDGKSPRTAWRSRCDDGVDTAAPVARRAHRVGPPRGRAALPRSPSLPRAHARGAADQAPAPAVGAEPLLLPDPHPHQGRRHPLQVGRSRLPPHVDPPHPRPRRRGGGRRGGARPLAAAGRRGGPRSRGGGELPLRPARRPLRLRCLRRSRARAEPGGGGGLVPHGVLRPRPHVEARARVGEALPVGERGHAGVFPLARPARPARLRGGHRLRGRPRGHLRDAGALRGRPHPEDGDPLAPARLRLRRLHRAGLGPRRSPRHLMDASSRPRLAPKARLRFARKSARYMLLYPARGLVLNPTAADVLQRCTGERTVESIVEELAQKYGHETPAVEREVMDFLQTMADRGLVQAAM